MRSYQPISPVGVWWQMCASISIAHLQRLSLRFYEDKQTGQLMSQVVNDSDLFETADLARAAGCVRQHAHPGGC